MDINSFIHLIAVYELELRLMQRAKKKKKNKLLYVV